MGTKRPKPPKLRKKGVGLYSYDQTKYARPFDYFGQIIVGVIIAALGVLILYFELVESKEQSLFRRCARLACVPGFVFFVIGMFIAHAGVIYWTKRIVKKLHSACKTYRHGN